MIDCFLCLNFFPDPRPRSSFFRCFKRVDFAWEHRLGRGKTFWSHCSSETPASCRIQSGLGGVRRHAPGTGSRFLFATPKGGCSVLRVTQRGLVKSATGTKHSRQKPVLRGGRSQELVSLSKSPLCGSCSECEYLEAAWRSTRGRGSLRDENSCARACNFEIQKQ